MIRHSVLALVLLGGTASAQPGVTATTELNLDELLAQAEAAAPTVETVARGTFRRARRAISIGPTLGVFGGYADGTDVALTFGIAVETFKVPVIPSIETVKALITERAKAQLKDRMQAVFAGRQPDPLELSALAAQVYTDVRDEILGMRDVRAKTMERPQLSFALEGNRYFDSSTWATRLRAGVGVWKLTVGASLAAAFTEPRTNVYVGPELVLHFLMSKGPRASVLDVFVRADLEVRSRGEPQSADIWTFGARYLLDVI